MRKPTYNVYITQETQPDEHGEKEYLLDESRCSLCAQWQVRAEYYDHTGNICFRQAGTPRTQR